MKVDNIDARTIPHSEQRYPTVGDWWVNTDNLTGKTTLYVRASDTGDWRANQSIIIHEIVEAVACIENGVEPESLDRFDTAYEMVREDAKTWVDAEAKLKKEFGGHCEITEDSEPGEDLHAPYRHQHAIATQVEWIVSEAMHLPWKVYEEEIAALDDPAEGYQEPQTAC